MPLLLLLAAALAAPPTPVAPPVATVAADAPSTEAAWKSTLERAVPAIVAIRMNLPRDFDTEDAGGGLATGFVVDAEKGIILTNRHVVTPGPVLSEAVFLDHEEVPLQALYRDPVHDFGFYRFDPAALKHMDVVALPLAPDAAEVGMEIRVVGNDAGEKISILDGTIARLDRDAPDYGGDTFNDFNTFYLQAASGTSGGSSGSPVLDVFGRVVGLNAGGRTQAASSFYLPLDRVVRALEYVRKGEVVPRGTLQTVFRYAPYDEIRRLGLSADAETALRGAFPAGIGALVVDQTVPEGPAWGQLEPGDVLLRVNGALLSTFVPLEDVLDGSVGGTVTLDVERAGKPVTVALTVQDLHAITPSEYLEVGRGVLHTVSYQQARNHNVPARGVYVAQPGYMFGRAGVPERAVITQVDGVEVPDLDAIQAAFERKAHGQRMVVRYHTVTDPRHETVQVVEMDRTWFEMQRCRRDDATGLWPCVDAAPPPDDTSAAPATETIPYAARTKVGKKLAESLVVVDFDIPYPTAGVKAFNYAGAGVVVDAERGWVLVDRDTVPVALGDISVLFAGSLRVPGRLLWIHPVHDVAIVQYDPALLGDTPVVAAPFVDQAFEQGDDVWLIGLDSSHRIVEHQTTIDRVDVLRFGTSSTPRFRDYDVEGYDLASSDPSIGGVLADKKGRVRALWASFVDQGDGERTFHGLPTVFLPEAVWKGGELADACAFGAELYPINLAEARDRGLSFDRARELIAADPRGRRVLEVQRVMGGSAAEASGLRDGDLLAAARVSSGERVVVRFPDLERLARDTCEEPGELVVVRDGAEVTLPFRATKLSGAGTDRAVSWAGMVLHDAHPEVALQQGEDAPGVYVTWLWYGTPGARYQLRPTRRITSVNDAPTPDLDAFLRVVGGLPPDAPVRLTMVNLDGQPQVYSLKLDPHYWPTQVFERDERGVWSRR